MTIADPFAAIRRRVEEMKSSIELSLATGRAKDYAEYSRMVGEYSALMKVEGELSDIEQRYIEN